MKDQPGKADLMRKGAMNALEAVLAVGKGVHVMVVTDGPKLPVGRAFREGAEALGAETSMSILPEERPMNELPAELLARVEKRRPSSRDTVFINAFSGLGEETPLRIQLIKAEIGLGARVGHAPGITEEMMTEGPMSVDYRQVARQAFDLMERFRGAREVRITAPGGTDIKLSIEGRTFETDLVIRPGTMGNLPAGEVWCAPVEDAAEGIIVCDGSIGDLGQVERPLKILVRKGMAEEFTGASPALLAKLEKLLAVDEQARVMGELGIGLNPGARITGNLLEDEKAGRTGHIAFGENTEMPGGRNTSKTHRDFLFRDPTMVVTRADGRKATVLMNGVMAPR